MPYLLLFSLFFLFPSLLHSKAREFYFYDDDHVLIKKIVDDGQGNDPDDLTHMTERHITRFYPRREPPFGSLERVEECYFHSPEEPEKSLQTICFHYSPQGWLLKKDIYDANHQFAYCLSWEYDAHGNVTKETNALGESILREYDDNDNLIFQQGPDFNHHLENTYDFSNRLIRQEEVFADGQRFVTTHSYDDLGNCIATVDPYGHETRYAFDEWGHLVSIHYPPILDEKGTLVSPAVKENYDLAGSPVCWVDAKGNATYTDYNSRGQPIKIVYPDQTSEQLIYQLDGQLIQKIGKTGIRTVYTKDSQGRVLQEALYAPDGKLLKKMEHIYNAFHLLKSVDAEGLVTAYRYDQAGHLEWIQKGERLKQNVYDSLGRVSEEREWFSAQSHDYRSTMKGYDLLNRVIEERLHSSDGTLLHLSRYRYDAHGNRTFVQSGDQKTETEYNPYSQPIKITNGTGQVTRVVYNTQHLNAHGQRVLQAITTDPLGSQISHTYDTANRLVEIAHFNPFGRCLSLQTIYYDLCGNCCRVIDEVREAGEVKSTIETLYDYSPGHQETCLIEAAGTAEQKIRRTFYNAFGQKEGVIKPDGTLLSYTYDDLARLKQLKTSRGSIAYTYAYNLRDQVTRVEEVDEGGHTQTTEREYNLYGELIGEKLGHGLRLFFIYDRLGRVREMGLPDQTGVEYVYDAANVKDMHRLIGGSRVYSYREESHTLGGQVLVSHLAGENGRVHYTYDSMGRCRELKGEAFHQSIPEEGFDAAGNLQFLYAQGELSRFTYDDLYQLKGEEGVFSHAYAFDSLGNRKEKEGEKAEHNGLHQLIRAGQETFIYDLNGNLIRRSQGNLVVEYSYDALDRLVAVKHGEKCIRYFYDSFHRRLIKKEEGEEGQGGQEEEWFVYQGQQEIGRWRPGEGFHEWRLLSPRRFALSVAIEIKGERFVPIHDITGDVVCLLTHAGQVAERYRYTVFGEREIYSPQGEKLSRSAVGNPWQYRGKRVEEETGLVAFGWRDYDPLLARWLTPDPAGFIDGSNLYVYVHNHPLLYQDLFGLYGNFLFDFVYEAISKVYHTFSSLDERFFGPPEPIIKHQEIENVLERQYEKTQGMGFNYPFNYPEERGFEFERTAIYRLNEGFSNPLTHQPFDLLEQLNKGIGFITGILTGYREFERNFCHLGLLSNLNIQGVHSASFGFLPDAWCYWQAVRNYVAYEGVRELHKMWDEFFLRSSPQAIFLMICHSRGVVYVRNALMDFPEDLRKRIEVIAVAPGGYIDPSICRSIKHYVSQGDFIPLLDMAGRERFRRTIISLRPHPDAWSWFDHGMRSPTYQRSLKEEISEYDKR